MKREYQKPETMVVRVKLSQMISVSVNQTTSNAGIGYGGASTNDESGQGARVKDHNVWNDDWSE